MVRQPFACTSVTTAVSTSPASPIAGSTRTRAARVDLDDLAAGHVARHVEVVDRHVEEQPAGRRGRSRAAAAPGRGWRCARAAARRPRRAATAARDGRVRGVEAAVEADLERHAGGLDRGQRAIDLGQVERHRLLAEDRLAGLGGRDDQVGVGVGRRADRDRVDVVGAEQLLDVAAARRRRASPPRRARSSACASWTRGHAPRRGPGGRAARRACGRSGRRRSTPDRASDRGRWSASITSSRSDTTSSQRAGSAPSAAARPGR